MSCAAARTNAEIEMNTFSDLLGLQEFIIERVIEASHLPADSQNVHREEHAIDADEAEPRNESCRASRS